MALVFWLCVALIVYHHALYPLLLRSLGRRFNQHVSAIKPADNSAPAELPDVTIIVPAHNEGAVIAAKIRNLAELTYPPAKLAVVVALDGCTDATRPRAEAALAEADRGSRWRIVEYQTNIGKVAVLNGTIAEVQSDIVALSDASAMLAPDALIRAMAHFRDAQVGVVCGTYRLLDPGSEGERLYWAYQTEVKAQEAALAAPMGAHGAFYLFRRHLWSPIAADTINDDFVLPMQIVLKGYRAVYDPTIIAAELERSAAAQDFRRRIRIGAGNLQQVLRLASLGNPRRGWLAFVFLSGKALRALTPFLLLIAFVLILVQGAQGSLFFGALLVVAVAGLAIVAASFAVPPAALPPPLAWLRYFIVGHFASGLGSLLFLTGRTGSLWRTSSMAKQSPRPGATSSEA